MYSIALGLCLVAIGVFLMGYVAAIAVLKEYILWFENNELARSTINVISQFLAFGVVAIICRHDFRAHV